MYKYFLSEHTSYGKIYRSAIVKQKNKQNAKPIETLLIIPHNNHLSVIFQRFLPLDDIFVMVSATRLSVTQHRFLMPGYSIRCLLLIIPLCFSKLTNSQLHRRQSRIYIRRILWAYYLAGNSVCATGTERPTSIQIHNYLPLRRRSAGSVPS